VVEKLRRFCYGKDNDTHSLQVDYVGRGSKRFYYGKDNDTHTLCRWTMWVEDQSGFIMVKTMTHTLSAGELRSRGSKRFYYCKDNDTHTL